MENLSHSRHPNRFVPSLPKKACNGSSGFGFGSGKAAATTYDEVFGGPPRFGAPTLSPRLEDYCEIFGGFRGSARAAVSSIPVLDLPLIDGGDVYFDVRSPGFDYREVFGGFHDLDLAPSYEELLMERSEGGDGDSSDEAWTPAETESVSGGTEHSGKSPCFSNGGDSYESIDGSTEFSISYNKADLRGATNMSHGESHLAELGALPSYTFVVDEMAYTGRTSKEKHMKKTQSLVCRDTSGNAFGNDDRTQKYYSRTGSFPSKTFVTVSDINLKTQPSELPPPSRPPPMLKRDSSSSASNCRTTGSEGSVGDNSPPFFDVEVDASSAAVKEAMEKAQAKLKSAKELLERKRDVTPTSIKPGSVNDRTTKERKSSHNEMKLPVLLPEIEKNIGVARKSSDDKHGKKSLPSQGSAKFDGDDEWKEATQFFELVRTEKPGNVDGNSNTKDVSLQEISDFREQKQKEKRAAKDDLEKQERKPKGEGGNHEVERLLKTLGETTVTYRHKKHEKDRSAKNFLQEGMEEKSRNFVLHIEAENKLNGHGGLEKRENLVKSDQEENGLLADEGAKQKKDLQSEGMNKGVENQEQERKPHPWKVFENKQEHVFEWEENARRLREALGLADNESMLEVSLEPKEDGKLSKVAGGMDENEKKLKEALERIENGNRTRGARGKEENDRRASEALEKAENERRRKEALEQEERERRLKEACEKEENEQRTTEALQKVDNEKRMKEEGEEWLIKEAYEKEENMQRMKENHEKAEPEKKDKKVLEEEEMEQRMKKDCDKEEKDRRIEDAREKAELERRLKEALEQEEKERQQKEVHEREENERRSKEALERAESEKRLKEALEQEERERWVKEAREKEENEEKLKEAIEQEKKEGRLREAQERAESERRLNEALEQEEIETEAQEKEEGERGQRENYENQENEKKQHDCMRERIEKRLEDALEREENIEKQCVACERKKTNKSFKEALGKGRLEDTPEEDEHESEDDLKTLNEVREEEDESGQLETRSMSDDTCPWNDFEKKLKDANREEGFEGLDTGCGPFEGNGVVKQPGTDGGDYQLNRESDETSKLGAENIQEDVLAGKLKTKGEKLESSKGASVLKQNVETGTHVKNDRNRSGGAVSEGEKVRKTAEDGVGCVQRNPEESKCTSKMSSDLGNRGNKFTQQEERGSFCETQASLNQDVKVEKPLPPRFVRDSVDTTRKVEVPGNPSQNTGNKFRNQDEISMQREKEAERIKRERVLEMERLRKIEEEREREREREKDRMAFDQRALADARERLEKACAEAREKSLADKLSAEARFRAERAAVERATAEAREHAAEKAALEARERVERSVPDKQFQSSASFGASRYQISSAYAGADGESPQRYISRLERHRRTAERVAKALAEKNMRDLVVQREQAERNRLAENLDAEVKRWSSGKEGNIRALLSTLQYILGPESGWQPIPLTEVITSAAVKKAYRKATLSVHPDKLQQRGATIQQKYICEKVFDLLKEAWNRFNSEER